MANEEAKQQEGKGFTVQDRRRFSPDTGEARKGAPEETEAKPKGTEEHTQATSKSTDDALPEINFSTFVIGLSTQALMHLGEIANPISDKVEADVPAAK